MKRGLTGAQVTMLRDLERARGKGIRVVPTYRPIQRLSELKYATGIDLKHGSMLFLITDAGRKILREIDGKPQPQ